ncbi:hypothetical protein Tco_0439783 [Tanacetum coccineum]
MKSGEPQGRQQSEESGKNKESWKRDEKRKGRGPDKEKLRTQRTGHRAHEGTETRRKAGGAGEKDRDGEQETLEKGERIRAQGVGSETRSAPNGGKRSTEKETGSERKAQAKKKEKRTKSIKSKPDNAGARQGVAENRGPAEREAKTQKSENEEGRKTKSKSAPCGINKKTKRGSQSRAAGKARTKTEGTEEIGVKHYAATVAKKERKQGQKIAARNRGTEKKSATRQLGGTRKKEMARSTKKQKEVKTDATQPSPSPIRKGLKRGSGDTQRERQRRRGNT